MEFLGLPLLIRDGYLPRTSLKESIINSVGLILSTRMGTMPQRIDFGCDLWDKEFSDMMTSNKSDIRASLRNAVGKHEKRLYNLSVSFSSHSLKGSETLGMKVKVTGTYREDGEEKKFEATYALG